MKHDFHDEYQNYIESDMPDLWSRIEPNLKEKKGADTVTAVEMNADKQKRNRKAIYFIRAAVPAAACLCLLFIGMRAMQLHDKSAENEVAAATEEMYEPEAFYEESEDAAVDSLEEYAEAAEYDEFTVADEVTSGVSEGSEEDVGKAAVQWEEDAVETENAVTINSNGEPVEIEKAVLTKISVASEAMQEKGYAYTYTFRLEDDSSLWVYLTGEQCDDLEEQGMVIERKAAYSLVVIPAGEEGEKAEKAVGECFLQKIEKLP